MRARRLPNSIQSINGRAITQVIATTFGCSVSPLPRPSETPTPSRLDEIDVQPRLSVKAMTAQMM